MHVAITGASSGIGEAIAREMARAGAELTLVARRRDLLEALAKDCGPRTHIEEADLLDPARTTAWIATAEAALGPIDVLVNNAGIQVVAPFEDTDPDRGERVITLDLCAPIRITRAVVPGMLARKRGTIVDVVSVAGLVPAPGMAYYNAAKGGYANFSEGLREELRGRGVHVVTVYPGPVRTAMADAALAAYGNLKTPMPTGDAPALARLVRSAIERRKPRVVYPGFYRFARCFPNLSRWVTGRLAPRPKTNAPRE